MAPTCHPDLRKYAYVKLRDLMKAQVLLEEVRGDAGTCDLCQTGGSEHQGAPLYECSACRHTYHHRCIDVLRAQASDRGEPLGYGCPHCGRPWVTAALLEQQAGETARARSPRRGLPDSDGPYAFTFGAATRQYRCNWEDRATGGVCGQGPFDTFEHFYRHHATAHAGILFFECDLCEPVRGFMSALLLIQHTKDVHGGDPRLCDRPEPSASPRATEGEAGDPAASLAEKLELMDLDVVDSIEDDTMHLDE
ncbi:hypothetical protein BP00DRAFT_449748 [Aspergillus indologenus CBS 114.80]|uniref:RING-type domain-containing protein n=1 Tax=Aspergillus indologenus CBS 114.80 TaxID=1450541 RepID=A0A2V5J2Z0_9EURO|nr:hypothetical protein BP00DRAFT_449748 [Aspergillus indologenus CBS 114.80]